MVNNNVSISPTISVTGVKAQNTSVQDKDKKDQVASTDSKAAENALQEVSFDSDPNVAKVQKTQIDNNKKYSRSIKDAQKQLQELQQELVSLDAQRANLVQTLYTTKDGDGSGVYTQLSEISSSRVKIYRSIADIISSIGEFKDYIKDNNAAATDAIEELKRISAETEAAALQIQSGLGETITPTKGISSDGSTGGNIVSAASKYLGITEASGQYKMFTGGRTEHWCADFVTYVVKEAMGSNTPAGFGSPSVSGLLAWGMDNNVYLDTKNSSNKAQSIAGNVKPGDVVIFKEGISHTGVVSKVNSDGSFETIEGNTSDKVGARKYAASDGNLTGFIKMS